MSSSLREDGRGSVGAERVAAWGLVILAVGLTVAVVTGPGATVANDTPEASFEGSFDAETGTLSLEHAGGDAVRAGPTSALVVVVIDEESDNRRNVTWVADDAEAVGSYPVESGDEISVDDAAVDADGDGDVFDADATVGFELDAGDTARVVWRGRPLGAPDHVDATLDTYTVEDGG